MSLVVIFGGSLESPQWLIGGFGLKILDRWWGPTKVFCCSVNVHEVVVLFSDCGDTSTLFVLTELFDLFAFCAQGERPHTFHAQRATS